MCLNCGCGQLDTRHVETDIVRQDVVDAARGQGMSMAETVGNLDSALERVRREPAPEGEPAAR